MTREALAQFPLLWLSCAALVLFFVTFVGVLIWTSLPQQRALFERMGKLPREEEQGK